MTQNSFCKSHTVCLSVKAKKSIREECQFMDLLYKELTYTYLLHKPANNHTDYEWAFNKHGHYRNLLAKKEEKK
jgi:hypothetical protein